ncbi:MAG: hypothetical protein CM15mV48_580 [uncultured marine virus]|nr:MAG: hypothetical protein CM15mV48_580 [uncultured marine virus]
MTNNNYLPTTYQQFIHASRYADLLSQKKEEKLGMKLCQDTLTLCRNI